MKKERTRGSIRAVVAVVAAGLALAACSRDDARRIDSASGTMAAPRQDTGATQTAAVTQSIGPLIYVTKTDAGSVRDATQLQVTEDRFKRFVAAAESLAVLRQRDARVQQLSQRDLANAGSTDVDAGLKLLESSPAITRAVESTGISVRDYYVTGIALAGAMHYAADPDAAPPTPVSRENAELVRRHRAEIGHLTTLEQGAIVVAAPAGGDSASRDTAHRAPEKRP